MNVFIEFECASGAVGNHAETLAEDCNARVADVAVILILVSLCFTSVLIVYPHLTFIFISDCIFHSTMVKHRFLHSGSAFDIFAQPESSFEFDQLQKNDIKAFSTLAAFSILEHVLRLL